MGSRYIDRVLLIVAERMYENAPATAHGQSPIFRSAMNDGMLQQEDCNQRRKEDPVRTHRANVRGYEGFGGTAMRANAHTPVVIRAHCAAHVNRYGPCPACQRATLAAMQTQMTQATESERSNATASELLLRASQIH